MKSDNSSIVTTVGANDAQIVHIEPRSLRTFKSSEEYLLAMKEDLAEWLNTLYDYNIDVDNFMEKLETGVILCRHANSVMKTAREAKTGKLMDLTIPDKDVVYRKDVHPKTFHARDNVSNFISWCRTLQIHQCLLFETDDLVLRKNEKSFILCLLEVARKGAKFGVAAPLLVQMEEEIDREIEAEKNGENGHQSEVEKPNGPEAQVKKVDLKCLHEKVVDLLNVCSCPSQFPMVKVADGKYRIGDTKVLIFVRILRNHVMVRVGGGWDTLGRYLDRHDPCRCRSGHRFPTSAKISFMSSDSSSGPQMLVTYNRPEEATHQILTNGRPNSTKLKRRNSSGPTGNGFPHLLINGSPTRLASPRVMKKTSIPSSVYPDSIIGSYNDHHPSR